MAAAPVRYRVEIDDLHSHHFRVTLTVQRPTALQTLALPVWIEYMAHALRSLPPQAAEVPEGLVQQGGDWVFDEFSSGAGISSVGLEDKLPEPPTEGERKSILDLFR